jgi:hypothetical protein
LVSVSSVQRPPHARPSRSAEGRGRATRARGSVRRRAGRAGGQSVSHSFRQAWRCVYASIMARCVCAVRRRGSPREESHGWGRSPAGASAYVHGPAALHARKAANQVRAQNGGRRGGALSSSSSSWGRGRAEKRGRSAGARVRAEGSVRSRQAGKQASKQSLVGA